MGTAVRYEDTGWLEMWGWDQESGDGTLKLRRTLEEDFWVTEDS